MIKRYLARHFAGSPLGPLQKHMEAMGACADQLYPFMEAAIAGQWKRAGELRQAIIRQEHAGDELKRDIRLNLRSPLFLPLARVDLLDLLTAQDEIANTIRDLSGHVLGRELSFPETLGVDLLRFVERTLETTRQAQRSVSELHELLEAGFSAQRRDIVRDMIKEVDRLEQESDRMEIEARHSLYREEKSLDPVDVMFMYKVIDQIGDVADCAQHVGSRLQLLLAR
ncbi:TIGR00153 family protein [Natronospira bacteriovora]|uniref:TIGR00153 family protein n=1 Tax=Natronospira bacteriovora TaxID=3069753 RepID=A0ABU0W9Q7_9GAMM|nr:TIGR00153 family protein [Natronospira sp. AB-CW4]MDQ2069705.1 TIGR00153 family protein [Natronospira sp. AB-CW4]